MIGLSWYLKVVLISISLVDKDVEQFKFVHTFFLLRILFDSLAHFLIGLFSCCLGFFFCVCLFWLLILCQMAKIFSHSIGCFFTHLTDYFVVWRLLNFLRSVCQQLTFLQSNWRKSGCVSMHCGAFSVTFFSTNSRVSDLTLRCLMHVDLTFVQVRCRVLVPLLHEDVFSSTTCWGYCLFSNVHFWHLVKSQGVVVIWASTLSSILVYWLTCVNALLLLLSRLYRVTQSQV